MSIGNNPTFDGIPQHQVEAHLLDQKIDLYGTTIELGFVDHVRPMQKFDSVDALVAQLQADETRIREILAPALDLPGTPARPYRNSTSAAAVPASSGPLPNSQSASVARIVRFLTTARIASGARRLRSRATAPEVTGSTASGAPVRAASSSASTSTAPRAGTRTRRPDLHRGHGRREALPRGDQTSGRREGRRRAARDQCRRSR